MAKLDDTIQDDPSSDLDSILNDHPVDDGSGDTSFDSVMADHDALLAGIHLPGATADEIDQHDFRLPGEKANGVASTADSTSKYGTPIHDFRLPSEVESGHDFLTKASPPAPVAREMPGQAPRQDLRFAAFPGAVAAAGIPKTPLSKSLDTLQAKSNSMPLSASLDSLQAPIAARQQAPTIVQDATASAPPAVAPTMPSPAIAAPLSIRPAVNKKSISNLFPAIPKYGRN